MVKHFIILVLLFVPLLGSSQDYTVEKLPYSGNGDMYAPSYFYDQLVVCSNKKDRINKTVIDLSDKEPIDLYLISNSNGDSIGTFDKNIRTAYNDGPISFNASSTEFVVSRNIKSSKKNKNRDDDQNYLGLYWYSIDSLGAKLIDALPFNSESYNCSHPSLNSSGKTLYFSSDMPGGFGGLDIWKSEKINGVWGAPKNLGESMLIMEKTFMINAVNNSKNFFE